MIHKSPLIQGRFIKRYKRFFADIDVDGKMVVAHVPNTGSMKTCMEDNAECFLTHNPDPKRKLQWTLERIKINQSLVGVNTGIPNNLVFEAWQNQLIPHWTKFDRGQKEVKINDESRLDMTLWNSKDFPQLEKLNMDFIQNNEDLKKSKTKIHFIEIKNVTMAIDQTAMFPDAVTSRGAKHIEELVKLIDLGHTCEMVYVIQREDINTFKIASDIDPIYDKALTKAKNNGLLVTALKVNFGPNETKITGLFK